MEKGEDDDRGGGWGGFLFTVDFESSVGSNSCCFCESLRSRLSSCVSLVFNLSSVNVRVRIPGKAGCGCSDVGDFGRDIEPDRDDEAEEVDCGTTGSDCLWECCFVGAAPGGSSFDPEGVDVWLLVFLSVEVFELSVSNLAISCRKFDCTCVLFGSFNGVESVVVSAGRVSVVVEDNDDDGLVAVGADTGGGCSISTAFFDVGSTIVNGFLWRFSTCPVGTTGCAYGFGCSTFCEIEGWDVGTFDVSIYKKYLNLFL